MAVLFESINFGSLNLSNKIVIAPMCQYSATENGEVTFWHEQQWANYALSGAGLCIIEATAVQPEGRISYADLGLWSDAQIEKIQTALAKVKSLSPMPFAIQLAHAGRKASSDKPWQARGQLPPQHEHGWQTVSASQTPFQETDHVPHELSLSEIQKVIQDFAQSAKRAVQAGFDLIEIHAAHGYLLHQFMSPRSNHRTDEYGGSFENRIRLTLDVVRAIQAVVPKNYPVGIRISATDWLADTESWDLSSSLDLAERLDQLGLAYIHVSSGGLDVHQQIDVKANYQVPFSQAIKEKVKMPVIAVGLITEAQQAEEILDQGQADAIAIGRVITYNPRWPWHAAAQLGETMKISPQYLRSAPAEQARLFQSF